MGGTLERGPTVSEKPPEDERSFNEIFEHEEKQALSEKKKKKIQRLDTRPKCARCGHALITDPDTALRLMIDECHNCYEEAQNLLELLGDSREEAQEILSSDFIRLLKQHGREAYELRTSQGSTLRVERMRKGWGWQLTARGKIASNGWYNGERKLARRFAVLSLVSLC